MIVLDYPWLFRIHVVPSLWLRYHHLAISFLSVAHLLVIEHELRLRYLHWSFIIKFYVFVDVWRFRSWPKHFLRECCVWKFVVTRVFWDFMQPRLAHVVAVLVVEGSLVHRIILLMIIVFVLVIDIVIHVGWPLVLLIFTLCLILASIYLWDEGNSPLLRHWHTFVSHLILLRVVLHIELCGLEVNEFFWDLLKHLSCGLSKGLVLHLLCRVLPIFCHILHV